MSTKPHDLPANLQADLHQDGLLTDPDYLYDKDRRLTLNIEKLRRYIDQYGEPWF